MLRLCCVLRASPKRNLLPCSEEGSASQRVIVIKIPIPIVAASLLISSVSQADAKPRKNKPAPDFALRDRQGTLVRLSDLASPGKAQTRQSRKVVVLDFFRTDCAPCVKALPKLVALHNKFKGRGVTVLLVALLEQERGEQKLAAFLKRHPVPFSVLVDSYEVAAKKYVVQRGRAKIPALFVVDRKRVLREVVRDVTDGAMSRVSRAIKRWSRR